MNNSVIQILIYSELVIQPGEKGLEIGINKRIESLGVLQFSS